MAVFFKLYLTFIAFCLSLIVFLTSQEITFIDKLHPMLTNTKPLASYLTYLLVALFLTRLGVVATRWLDDDEISEGSLSAIEPASDQFLPVYLGYFFIALSLPSFELFLYVFGLICLFIFYSRSAYFNPLFYLFGFHFYQATNQKNIKVLIITRDIIKDPQTTAFTTIKRINDYTFIDRGE